TSKEITALGAAYEISQNREISIPTDALIT
ncbi:hypothetical protein MNBD_GAMMA07-1506, partial [hydrothermal vent metagenome]